MRATPCTPQKEVAKRSKSSEREGLPNLVLLDIMMPDMDGFAVAAELRRMGDIPIIFLSALSDVDTKVEGLTLYAEDYVTKPFALSELLARIRRILLRSGQRSDL